MGGAAPVEGKGKKKSLDAVINLVPFIDLLSSLIAFLLMTAVWTQIATLQVGQQGSNNPNPTPPPEEIPKLSIAVSDRGFVLASGADQVPVEKAGNDYDFDALNKKLGEIKGNVPEMNDVTVMPEDGIVYDVLVRVIDACLGARMLNVTLQPPST